MARFVFFLSFLFFSIKSLTLQLSSNLTPLLSSQNKLMHFAGRVQLQAQTVKRRPSTFLPPTASLFFFSHLARWQLPRLNLELFTIRWNHVRPLLPFVFLIYKNNHQNGTSNCILSLCSLQNPYRRTEGNTFQWRQRPWWRSDRAIHFYIMKLDH